MQHDAVNLLLSSAKQEFYFIQGKWRIDNTGSETPTPKIKCQTIKALCARKIIVPTEDYEASVPYCKKVFKLNTNHPFIIKLISDGEHVC